MRATDNFAAWMKIGYLNKICFIMKDVICYSSGCFINFINISTREEKKITVNSHAGYGDGVSVVRGHRSEYIFAYAENKTNAILYVKRYPNFEEIATFFDGPPEGIGNMAFSETSLLVTVGEIPNFTITVWNWRKLEKIGEFKNSLHMENQILRCSWGKPIYMTQMVRFTNHLYMWDVFTCCRRAIVAKHKMEMPDTMDLAPFSDLLWTTEGGLFIVDLRGTIYTGTEVMSLEIVIKEELTGEVKPSICWYKNGLAVNGPNHEIRHYKKTGDWTQDWVIKLDVVVINMYGNKADYMIGVTNQQEIVKISNTEELVFLKHNDTNFNDFCLIYPTGEHIVALRCNKILTVYETVSGKWVSNFELKEDALAMAENPEFPYIAIGYATGVLELISVYKPEKLSVMASFNLSHNPISSVQFFEQGRVIVTGYLSVGEFFLIEGLPGTQMKVIISIAAKRQIVDYMLVASKHCYRLFLLPVTTKFLAGNKILRYCIISKETVNYKEYQMEDVDALYYRILPTVGQNRDRLFYLLPFKARNIHLLETKRGDPLARLVSEIKTGHPLRKFYLRITKTHAVTWGYDGFVIARDNNFEQPIGLSLVHHRYHGGVKKAYVDPLGKYLISLGRENVLACTNMVANRINEALRSKLNDLKRSVKYAVMFKRPTIGFQPEARFKGKTWLEVEAILKTEHEQELCVEEKLEIEKEFLEIQGVLTGLVTKNYEGPDNERLDILEFYLDTGLYNKKKDKNRENCKETEIYLKALIVAQDEVSQHLLKNYWQTMIVKGKTITGIFSVTAITNYSLLPNDPKKNWIYDWICEQRKVEQFLSRDNFEPWVPISEEELLIQFQKPTLLETEDYGNIRITHPGRHSQSSLTDTVNEKSMETQIALQGSIAVLFIEISPAHFKQNEIVSFYQCDLEQHITDCDAILLKKHYNAMFEDMMTLKKREMGIIKERNARLRTIVSEINYFSEKKMFVPVVDPEWAQSEEPELITKVFEHELTISPYISPSQQAILDAQAAEDERIRLALLADDFKERALMAMMNGVLEVRWEDELKKDVPIPKCLIEKDPEKYNEEDFRSIRDYEEKVIFLNSERERYKNLLDVEFTKLTTSMRDSIRKFNQKLKDSVEYKTKIDSALTQNDLKSNRLWTHQNYRCNKHASDDAMKCEMKSIESTIQKIQKTIVSLHEEMAFCRTTLEQHEAKEKLLEKAFRKDIQIASPVAQEQAAKIYKKRPKWNIRLITTAILLELSRCVGAQERSLVLPLECIDYLKSVDQLDLYVGVPAVVDENLYHITCKHRRLRMEFEVKLKAYQFRLFDAETTISTFQRRIAKNKEAHAKLAAELTASGIEYIFLIHNIQTQMVLRRGLVEVPLNGEITDYNGAILVPKKEVVAINKLIIAAGKKKLDVIMQNMGFRRKIMAVEWEHKRLRMIINDLIEQLIDIESVQLTKEMQHYLKAKKLGRATDAVNFETEIEIIAASFENRIKDMKEKLGIIKKQIHSYKAHNTFLDKAIADMNIDVCYFNLQKDKYVDDNHKKTLQDRMDALLKRNCLIQQIQRNHNEIMVLQTELELLRLKTYPTFKYKVLCNQ